METGYRMTCRVFWLSAFAVAGAVVALCAEAGGSTLSAATTAEFVSYGPGAGDAEASWFADSAVPEAGEYWGLPVAVPAPVLDTFEEAGAASPAPCLVPEPATMVLMGIGLAVVLANQRRTARRKTQSC